MPPPPDLSTLSFSAIERLARAASPPLDAWNPPLCGDSAMRIAADGRWYHQGQPIERPALVRLFARILRREADGSHVLVTPHEKLTIAVDDAPFTATDLRVDGAGSDAVLAFGLDTGDPVIADAAHPLTVRGDAGSPRPYLTVRGGLEALVARPVYYRLAELASEHGGRLGVWSMATFFPLEPTP